MTSTSENPHEIANCELRIANCPIRNPKSAIRNSLGILMLLWVAGIGLAAEQGEWKGYDSKGKRDPFVPLARDGKIVSPNTESAPTSSAPLLAGIVWDPGGRSLALINETEVMIGEWRCGGADPQRGIRDPADYL
jgi:hypothetical protein